MSEMQTSATNFKSLPSGFVSGSKAVTIYSAKTRQLGAVFPTMMKRHAKMHPAKYRGLVKDSCNYRIVQRMLSSLRSNAHIDELPSIVREQNAKFQVQQQSERLSMAVGPMVPWSFR